MVAKLMSDTRAKADVEVATTAASIQPYFVLGRTYAVVTLDEAA
jgi:hypothetical protein